MTHKEAATKAFDTVEADLIDISNWMHDYPELGYQEHQASAKLAGFLADHGFAVSHPTHGLETAFEASAGSSGPKVVICCEYDALPDIGHACGHNIIATAALGAGKAVAGLADELGIRVTVLGTPAEEGGGGKVDLINAGAFDDAAASMMIHPSPAIFSTLRSRRGPHTPLSSTARSPMPRLPLNWVSTPWTVSSRLI